MMQVESYSITALEPTVCPQQLFVMFFNSAKGLFVLANSVNVAVKQAYIYNHHCVINSYDH